ncbi:hypothetical protein ACFQY5_40065 [Paeniroseomonas aquatica]|uniref:Uncharacterized protein n=1 Tax=Paeniroseomonas aquatica TaxID=373043 RepID=A0ABT8A074_9PROT|nr:hypothetical protein [Paeniroseomonas aquatica]MDN3563120.1 hypothetical protein [Paeniroseomonas aquatica]
MSDVAAVEADPEPYTSEELEEAAQAMPEMHAVALRHRLVAAKLLGDVRAMPARPMQASLVSAVEELGRAAESLCLATSRPATTLAEADAAMAAIDDALAAFNTSNKAVGAAMKAAVGRRCYVLRAWLVEDSAAAAVGL